MCYFGGAGGVITSSVHVILLRIKCEIFLRARRSESEGRN